MKLAAKLPTILICSTAISVQAQTIARFEHIIVVVQENRTPDNLFQGLCKPPFGTAGLCSTTPSINQYNIQTGDWLNNKSSSGKTKPGTVQLANKYDLGHGHPDFVAMCDLQAGACKMDGAAGVSCRPAKNCPTPYPQFNYVDNSTGILNPYLQLASQYGWANYMFQTNQGPSFPAHQFLFGATSAPNAPDDHAGTFAAENMSGTGISGTGAAAGCTAPDGPPPKPETRVKLINSAGSETALAPIYPCFDHDTMANALGSSVSWRYYAPNATSIWTAPNAIKQICQSSGPGGHCTGSVWTDHVDLSSADVLRDINNCNLRQVSWVIPTGQNSDHANDNDGGGPSWVAAIVNGIGHSSTCDSNHGYWKNTAVVITWDDWGGWYDHEAPTILAPPEGGYQYGFRVPLIFVSAYTSMPYINNDRHDFGSILRLIEHNFGITEGTLTFADARATSDLTAFYDLSRSPRNYKDITAPKNAAFFLNDKREAKDPDDQ